MFDDFATACQIFVFELIAKAKVLGATPMMKYNGIIGGKLELETFRSYLNYNYYFANLMHVSF